VRVRGPLPEDLERGQVAVVDEPIVQVAPTRPPLTPGEWVRRNLFSSWFNSALTVVTGALALYVAFRFMRFIFVTGDWAVVKANLRVYMVGRFPLDEMWRVWMVVYFLAVLVGLSRGVLAPPRWTGRELIVWIVMATLGLGVISYLVDSLLVWTLLAVAAAVFAGAVVAGRRGGRRLRRPLLVGWLLAFPAVVLLLSFGAVSAEQWGGLLLNVMVAVVVIALSFPLGILLALGRRSSLPIVSGFCVGFIELIRGVPLLTLLIFGRFVLILLLPPGLTFAQLVRAIFMFTIFSAAYVAEIVRGGLQGVPEGQYEAARALGLSTTRTMTLVALPQALRNTIPPMIGHFISVFKDTSLLAALAIFSDLLATARRASQAFEFVGHQAEALLPAAFLFWMIAFSMSRWSQRVERRLGVGER
jgi:general L-amino acid transport system permease protein